MTPEEIARQAEAVYHCGKADAVCQPECEAGSH